MKTLIVLALAFACVGWGDVTRMVVDGFIFGFCLAALIFSRCKKKTPDIEPDEPIKEITERAKQ